jgi:hypothetical protein
MGKVSLAWPITIIDPIITTPCIAFAPDIKGVCSTAGTCDITSMPRNIERMIIKIKSLYSKINFKISSIKNQI